MDWQSFMYGALSILLLGLVFTSLGVFHVGALAQKTMASGNAITDGVPEKCKAPAGQDLASWKEHLGHHAETRECLKYYS